MGGTPTTPILPASGATATALSLMGAWDATALVRQAPRRYLAAEDGEDGGFVEEEADDGFGVGADASDLPMNATVLMEAEAGCEAVPTHETPLKPAAEEPLLSLVSLNPRRANTFDIVRGSLQVLPELPIPSTIVRTVQISCGRATANTIVLKDGRVSLRHFTVRVRAAAGGRVALDLLDLSTNGTWVNGQRVGHGRRQRLVVGDRIAVLPASQVGRQAEIGYLLMHDTRGARCLAASAAAAAAEAAASSASSGGVPHKRADDAMAAGSSCGVGAAAVVATQEAADMPQLGNTLPRALERDLRCGICADALHRCLTLVPCGHNFCTVCLVRWRRSSPACPECRHSVRKAVQNVDVDRVVETFLRVHPEVGRSPKELAIIDAAEKDHHNQLVLQWLLRDPAVDAFVAAQRVATPARRAARSPQARRASRGQRPRHSTACAIS